MRGLSNPVPSQAAYTRPTTTTTTAAPAQADAPVTTPTGFPTLSIKEPEIKTTVPDKPIIIPDFLKSKN